MLGENILDTLEGANKAPKRYRSGKDHQPRHLAQTRQNTQTLSNSMETPDAAGVALTLSTSRTLSSLGLLDDPPILTRVRGNGNSVTLTRRRAIFFEAPKDSH